MKRAHNSFSSLPEKENIDVDELQDSDDEIDMLKVLGDVKSKEPEGMQHPWTFFFRS
jgi:hypothetical protein